LKLESYRLGTARHFARAQQGPLEGRPAAHPFAAEWKAIPGHFGRA
jgi:hypothetical protein